MIIMRHDPSLAMASALDYGRDGQSDVMDVLLQVLVMYSTRYTWFDIMLHCDPQLVYSLAIQRAVHASLNGVVRLVTRR